MKNKKIFASIAILSAMAASASFPFNISADEAMLYGTMDIPYSDFYKGEFGESPNAYEVDAVSSATTSKWSKNKEGELFEGTFNQANDDGTGKILGVTYSVAISKADLDSLGENNYNFSPLDSEPSAYKNVTVSDGAVNFSAVSDNSPEKLSGISIKLNTASPWGDFVMDFENNSDIGVIYGALIKTTDGKTYAMRHEENIWRGELAWSSGIVTSEPHGNTLNYENFTDLMGSTVSEVVFITKDGYKTLETNTYIPVKFVGEIKIENAASGTGKTSLQINDFPADYEKSYSVNSEGFTVNDTEISYENALSGQYALTISDKNGKYADMTANFILSTDSLPAAYSDKKLVKAENSTDEEFMNFVKNISAVTVNEKEYKASGKGSVKIIDENGNIDFSASSKDTAVFDGSNNYKMTVTATGYNKSLEFVINEENKPAETSVSSEMTVSEETSATSETSSKETTKKDDNSSKSDSSKDKTNSKSDDKKSSSKTENVTDTPKTGDSRTAALPVSLLTLAGITAILARKKAK